MYANLVRNLVNELYEVKSIIYICLYNEKSAKELKSRPKWASFFSKGDDIKIIKEGTRFFSTSTRLSSFQCPFLLFSPVYMACRRPK